MTRDEQKLVVLLRAQLSLKHAMERIDHRHDVIKPQLEQMKKLAETNNVELVLEEGDLDASLGLS